MAEAICEHLLKLGFGIILCARSENKAYRLQVREPAAARFLTRRRAIV